jgi:transposase
VDVENQRVLGSREVTCESCSESDLPRAINALRKAIVHSPLTPSRAGAR